MKTVEAEELCKRHSSKGQYEIAQPLFNSPIGAKVFTSKMKEGSIKEKDRE